MSRCAVLDMIMSQAGRPPFDPRQAVLKFCHALRQYNCSTVTADAYAGLTFAMDFQSQGVQFRKSQRDKTEIYEAFEPHLNAGEIELLDVPILTEQLMCLVVKGRHVDHETGQHDDWVSIGIGSGLKRALRQRRQFAEFLVEFRFGQHASAGHQALGGRNILPSFAIVEVDGSISGCPPCQPTNCSTKEPACRGSNSLARLAALPRHQSIATVSRRRILIYAARKTCAGSAATGSERSRQFLWKIGPST